MKSRSIKKIKKYHTFIPVDVFPHSIWDEDLGTMVTPNGIEKCIKAVEGAIADGWKFQELEFSSDEETLFLIQLSRKEAPSECSAGLE